MVKNIVSKIDVSDATSKLFDKTSKLFEVYLTIINSIEKYQKLPGGILSKQALNKYVKRLKIDGVISRVGYGTWQLNHDNFDRWAFKKQVNFRDRGGHHLGLKKFTSYNSDIDFRKPIRGHGFQWRLKVPIGSKGVWFSRSQILARLGFACKKLRNGVSITFESHVVHCWGEVIVFYSPRDKSYFASSAEESRQFALFDIIELVGRFERKLGISLRSQGKFALDLDKQHYGDVGNELAKQRARDGKYLDVSNYDGKWLLADCSHGLVELECVHPVSSVSDMDEVIKPFFNDLKETRLMPSDILNMFSKVGGWQKSQSDLMGMYAENMKSHVKAVQDLGSGVQAQTVVFSELAEVVKSIQVQIRDDGLVRARRLREEWGW